MDWSVVDVASNQLLHAGDNPLENMIRELVAVG